MTINIPRGTKDILPEEMHYWHHVESTSRTIFDLYNFQEIRTPIFEMTELFQKSIGDTTDIVEKEMYTFLDKGDRSITLRPEGTAPLSRAYISNGLHKKDKESKLYYIGPMFRYERPQAGRFRQFHQIGVEHIGSDHPSTDAQVIAIGIHLFDALGLSGLNVQINSVGCPICRPVIEQRLKQFLGGCLDHLCQDCNRRFETQPLRILDCKKASCKNYFTGMPDIKESICQECKDHFNMVLEYLDSLNISFNINPLLVRGLDYYSRTTFEIVSKDLGAQNALCGGGRYNGLIKQLGGPPTPAVGLAFGVERAVMILQQVTDTQLDTSKTIFVAPLGFAQQGKCFELLDMLRREGFKCEFDFSKTDLKPLLKRANKLGAYLVLIYGEEEAENKQIIVKNMTTNTQETILLSDLIQVLKHDQQLQNPLF